LGIVTLLTEAMKTQRGLQAKDAQREVMAEITQHLGDGAACLNTFSGINPPQPQSLLTLLIMPVRRLRQSTRLVKLITQNC